MFESRDKTRQSSTIDRQASRTTSRSHKTMTHSEAADSFAAFVKAHNARIARG